MHNIKKIYAEKFILEEENEIYKPKIKQINKGINFLHKWNNFFFNFLILVHEYTILIIAWNLLKYYIKVI